MAKKRFIPGRQTYLKHDLVIRLFEEMIQDSYDGRRLSKKGLRIAPNSIRNYEIVLGSLKYFCRKSNFHLRIYLYDNLSIVQRDRAANWYLKFYNKFIHHLYEDKKAYDNYVGYTIKVLRTFFSYLEIDRNVTFGPYRRYFIVPREEIPVIALRPDQLQYIIHSRDLLLKLKPHQIPIRDIFIFGCTIGLRYGDLMSLTSKNLVNKNGSYYISIKSSKTKTLTSVKLPPYAVEIIKKYQGQHPTLLPFYCLPYFNKQLKLFAKHLPHDFVYPKTRERRGKPVVVYKFSTDQEQYHLSDHISSHTMRRTAITTLIILGVPEMIVRQISGHGPNSKEFNKYVQMTQAFKDEATDRAFDNLCVWNPYHNVNNQTSKEDDSY